MRRTPLAFFSRLLILAGAAPLISPAAEAPYGIDRRPEAPPYLGMPPTPVFARAGRWTTEPAFLNVTFRNPIFLESEPGTHRLFVGELEGRIYAIDERDSSTSDKQPILDLSAHTQGGWDCGMLGFTFHPDYAKPDSPNRGVFFVWYSWVEQPVVRPEPEMITWTRLSRFKVDPQTGKANAADEVVLINQHDLHIFHAGGGMFFNPKDGFLYCSSGDEGPTRSAGNVQRIDKNLFSGILRIDVDQRGGNISHPIRQQPADGQTAHYYIPNDNPFVGVPGALEEFYAIGLRSPHRMTYDPVDNLAWIGEIGNSTIEEISVLEFGRSPLNFQWDVLEGKLPGTGSGIRQLLPNTISTDPIFDYGREQGRSVIGGYVYRGNRFPALKGKYIFGDFGSGRLWALSYTPGAPPRLKNAEVLGETPTTNYNYRGSEGGLTSFGRGHDDELYLLLHGFYTRVARLVEKGPQTGNLPALLSQTGVFDDVTNLVPAPGLIPYDVNLPQWTDHMPARRWISVPSGKKIAFSRDDRWTLPAGTVLVQHFEIPAEASAEGKVERLETRLLVAAADGTFYAAGYRWRADHSDAELVTHDSGRSYTLKGDERRRDRSWALTTSQKCLECHTPGAGFALGLKTRQINRDFAYPGGTTDQQLRTWNHLGLFDASVSTDAAAEFARLSPPDKVSASLEERVRSFLDVNCAHCHGNSPVRAAWDGRYSTPLAEQRIVNGPILGEIGGPGYNVIAPKDPGGSILLRRVATRDFSERMPPVGVSQPDPQFVSVLQQWIESLPRPEKNPPQLVGLRRRGETGLTVVFSEAVQAGAGSTGAERVENYALDGGAKVLSVKLSEDLRTVLLTTSPLSAKQLYTLKVRGIADRADQPNAIAGEAAMTLEK